MWQSLCETVSCALCCQGACQSPMQGTSVDITVHVTGLITTHRVVFDRVLRLWTLRFPSTSSQTIVPSSLVNTIRSWKSTFTEVAGLIWWRYSSLRRSVQYDRTLVYLCKSIVHWFEYDLGWIFSCDWLQIFRFLLNGIVSSVQNVEVENCVTNRGNELNELSRVCANWVTLTRGNLSLFPGLLLSSVRVHLHNMFQRYCLR